MNDPIPIHERVAESAAQRIRCCFQAAHSALSSLSRSDRSVALARFLIYFEQRHFKSAVHSLEEVLAPEEPDLGDLQEVYLRLTATLTRNVSMEHNIKEAHAYLDKLIQNLVKWAAIATGDDRHMGIEPSVDPQDFSEDKRDISYPEVLYRYQSIWPTESAQEFLPQIESMYWSVQLTLTVNRHRKDTDWSELSLGLSRLRKLVERFCREERIVEAAEVIDTYCHIIAVAPLITDDALTKEIQSATAPLFGLKNETSTLLIIWANSHVNIANVYHQYVCRRGGTIVTKQRDAECDLAAELFLRCNHSFGNVMIKFLRRYEYGFYTDLQELADIARQHESLQCHGARLQVLQFRADIAVTLRDYRAYSESVRDIKELTEETGAFFSEARYTYEPDTKILAADRGKILEGVEASLEALLNDVGPDTGAEASLCEILADANMDNLAKRSAYLQQMLDASLRDKQLFLASYAAGELAVVRISLMDANHSPNTEAVHQDLQQFVEDWIVKDEEHENWDSQCKKLAILVRLSARSKSSSVSSGKRIETCLTCAEKLDANDARHSPTMVFVVQSLVLAWLNPSEGGNPPKDLFVRACRAWRWALKWVEGTVHEGDARLGICSTLIQMHRSYPLETDTFIGTTSEHLKRAKKVSETWDDINIKWRAHMLAFMVWEATLDSNSDSTDAASHGLEELDAAEKVASHLRNELSALGGLRAFKRKRKFVAESSYHIVKLAIRLCHDHLRTRPVELWKWTQYGKARSLSDLLGESVNLSLPDLQSIDANGRQYLEQKQYLVQQIESAQPERRFNMRKQLEDVHKKIETNPELRDIVDIWEGRALKLEDVSHIGCIPQQAIVYVDWVEVDDMFAVTTNRPGESPSFQATDVTIQFVREWIEVHLNISDLSKSKADKWLRELAPLVWPLLRCTKPEDLLVLSPTGPLHALPLHALEIEAGKPLLERNPVVYSTSLSILRLCMLRRKHQPLPASPSAVIFGDPSGDRKGAADSATIIADLLNVEPKIGGDATKDLFLTAGRDVDMICFYGHAHTLRRPSSRVNLDQGAFMSSLLSSNYPPSMSKDASPLQDSIEFANKVYLEVREIFELKLRGHVSLFACGSGEQTIEIGDEPSGLITALLVAGASSVLGTLWPIADDDGRDFSILFYRKLLERPEKSVIVNIAEAVRFASLKLRGRAQRDRPFNWASFVLHGAWFWKGATGEDEEGERNL